MKTSPHKKAGFSLIELMIAMLIGLVILNGVVQLVINSKRSYLDNQAISQIQENARFALDTLSRELRIAGYFGCMSANSGEIGTDMLTDGSNLILDGDPFASIQIIKNAKAGGADVPDAIGDDLIEDTDILVVRHTDPDNEWLLEEDLSALGGELKVTATKTLPSGTPIALVSHDCSVANLLNATVNTSVTATNANGKFSLDRFKKGSRVAPVVAYAYYIGNSKVLDGMPALKRARIVMDGSTVSSRSEELAIGVSNMTLLAGNIADNTVKFVGSDPEEDNSEEGADGGGSAVATITADTVAVRVELELRSHKKLPLISAGEGDEAITSLEYLFKSADATVSLRNRG